MTIPYQWVCGYITYPGYLYCRRCMPSKKTRESYFAVYSDSFPHNEEKCELCKRVVKEVEE